MSDPLLDVETRLRMHSLRQRLQKTAQDNGLSYGSAQPQAAAPRHSFSRYVSDAAIPRGPPLAGAGRPYLPGTAIAGSSMLAQGGHPGASHSPLALRAAAHRRLSLQAASYPQHTGTPFAGTPPYPPYSSYGPYPHAPGPTHGHAHPYTQQPPAPVSPGLPYYHQAPPLPHAAPAPTPPAPAPVSRSASAPSLHPSQSSKTNEAMEMLHLQNMQFQQLIAQQTLLKKLEVADSIERHQQQLQAQLSGALESPASATNLQQRAAPASAVVGASAPVVRRQKSKPSFSFAAFNRDPDRGTGAGGVVGGAGVAGAGAGGLTAEERGKLAQLSRPAYARQLAVQRHTGPQHPARLRLRHIAYMTFFALSLQRTVRRAELRKNVKAREMDSLVKRARLGLIAWFRQKPPLTTAIQNMRLTAHDFLRKSQSLISTRKQNAALQSVVDIVDQLVQTLITLRPGDRGVQTEVVPCLWMMCVAPSCAFPPGFLWLAEKAQMKFGTHDIAMFEKQPHDTQRQMLFLDFVVLRVLVGDMVLEINQRSSPQAVSNLKVIASLLHRIVRVGLNRGNTLVMPVTPELSGIVFDDQEMDFMFKKLSVVIAKNAELLFEWSQLFVADMRRIQSVKNGKGRGY